MAKTFEEILQEVRQSYVHVCIEQCRPNDKSHTGGGSYDHISQLSPEAEASAKAMAQFLYNKQEEES